MYSISMLVQSAVYKQLMLCARPCIVCVCVCVCVCACIRGMVLEGDKTSEVS